MHTVPSLVGTGTAIAAAATGFVFGQPSEPEPYTNGPESHSQQATAFRDQDPLRSPRLDDPPRPRPFTSSARRPVYVEGLQHNTLPSQRAVSRPPLSRYQRPRSSHYSQPNAGSRPQSAVRRGDSPIRPQPSRDSVSSNSSWVRRLSIRPLSQHESPRSSIAPDSHSIAFSHGSAAPILSPSDSVGPPLPPNKLVKRTSSTQNRENTALARPRAKSHLPALRRPATSHQRSATLQQQQHLHSDSIPGTPIDSPLQSPILNTSVHQPFQVPTSEQAQAYPSKPGWVSYFHLKASTFSGRSAAGRLGEFTPQSRNNTRRLSLGTNRRQTVHLVKPRMVSGSSAPAVGIPAGDIDEEAHQPAEQTDNRELTPEHTPSKVAKRSMSMTFSAAGNWVSRTSGSLRRPKRGADPISGSKRIVSDPVTTLHPAVEHGNSATQEGPIPPLQLKKQGSTIDSATISPAQRQRNISSPLPPLSRLSSFHVDLSRLGPSGGATNHPLRPNQSSPSSTSSTVMSQFRAPQAEKPPPPADSTDTESRAFLSGDDDDTDFRSDTMFDSLRTVASGRVRTVETPLDSMYDDSPPSTAGNGKTKRLSIQEILGKGWDEDNKIMEEDESVSTPMRSLNRGNITDSPPHIIAGSRFSLEASTDGQAPSINDFNRLSLDDDFDEDWARDDDAPYNALSAPSRGSPASPRGVNPNVRLALANISGNGTFESNNDGQIDRPVSHLFDWSEPAAHEKQDGAGRSPRPKTAYGKQETDTRGGRSSTRKGPTPMHVRSQSVPVVHDPSDESKSSGSKYGTWGLGTKTISEDWDDDFEFGIGEAENDEISHGSVFAVPESIQATQPSVKAHSGQIRELSLLVNDLKRLCRHARDMDILEGQQKGLWKEAEGIIALASPDEDALDGNDQSPPLVGMDTLDANERFLEDAFDAASLERFDAAFDGHEPVISKTAVVRERHSPRRRSVFSPDDDIFGNWPLPDDAAGQPSRQSRPRTPETRSGKPQDMTGVVRSVMEAVQRTSTPAPPQPTNGYNKNNRMHFDTNSLKVLVKRAGELRDSLADIVRRADQITQSPARTPRHDRHADSSPAFTRVFEDPGSSPPRRVMRSRGTTPLMDSTSPGNSPSSSLSRRVHMMKVG